MACALAAFVSLPLLLTTVLAEILPTIGPERWQIFQVFGNNQVQGALFGGAVWAFYQALQTETLAMETVAAVIVSLMVLTLFGSLGQVEVSSKGDWDLLAGYLIWPFATAVVIALFSE